MKCSKNRHLLTSHCGVQVVQGQRSSLNHVHCQHLGVAEQVLPPLTSSFVRSSSLHLHTSAVTALFYQAGLKVPRRDAVIGPLQLKAFS